MQPRRIVLTGSSRKHRAAILGAIESEGFQTLPEASSLWQLHTEGLASDIYNLTLAQLQLSSETIADMDVGNGGATKGSVLLLNLGLLDYAARSNAAKKWGKNTELFDMKADVDRFVGAAGPNGGKFTLFAAYYRYDAVVNLLPCDEATRIVWGYHPAYFEVEEGNCMVEKLIMVHRVMELVSGISLGVGGAGESALGGENG